MTLVLVSKGSFPKHHRRQYTGRIYRRLKVAAANSEQVAFIRAFIWSKAIYIASP
jgi:hypothetical protein